MPPNAPSDGLAQLTELMRQDRAPEPRVAPPAVDPERRRRRRRRNGLVSGAVTLALLASLGGYTAFALTAEVGTATFDLDVPAIETPAAAQVHLSPDGATAVRVHGGERYLGAEASDIWAAAGGDGPRPMASISKLVTALVILDAKPLAGPDDPGPTITFDRDDHALYDKYYLLNATIAAMPAGSSMSLQDALEAMLIVSACNYAEAVSTWAFGSQSAFLRAAETWLAEHGLTSTKLVEPTGIDARNTSTPADLIALGELALANPAIARIVQQPTLDVPHIPPASNTNDLLGLDGVTGLKTGTLEGSGSNLLFSATLNVGIGEPLEIVGVVLGGGSHESVNRDVRALLQGIRDGFHDVPLGERGQQIGSYRTPWGESADIVLGQPAGVRTWSDTPVSSTYRVDTITTGHRGDRIGEISWTAGPNTVSVPLVLGENLPPPTAWWRLTHPGDLRW